MKYVAKKFFERNQCLQIHVKVLDLHNLCLSHDHWLLEGQENKDFKSTFFYEIDLGFGSLSRCVGEGY